jgi:hypothetical protein
MIKLYLFLFKAIPEKLFLAKGLKIKLKSNIFLIDEKLIGV